MSADTGKILADLPIGVGVDATKFDGSQAFASCRDGKLEVASETRPGKFSVVETVETPMGARTMTADPSTHTLYLPTAELEPAEPGTRPQTKPGSLKIVVVSRKSKQ